MPSTPAKDALTTRARRLAKALKHEGFAINHSRALRLVAAEDGDRNEHVSIARARAPQLNVAGTSRSCEDSYILNPAQIVLFEAYPDADLLPFTADSIKTRADFDMVRANSGDTIFSGLLAELGTSEDCDSAAEAIRRVGAILSDTIEVLAKLQNLPESGWPDPGPADAPL